MSDFYKKVYSQIQTLESVKKVIERNAFKGKFTFKYLENAIKKQLEHEGFQVKGKTVHWSKPPKIQEPKPKKTPTWVQDITHNECTYGYCAGHMFYCKDRNDRDAERIEKILFSLSSVTSIENAKQIKPAYLEWLKTVGTGSCRGVFFEFPGIPNPVKHPRIQTPNPSFAGYTENSYVDFDWPTPDVFLYIFLFTDCRFGIPTPRHGHGN